MHELDDPHIHWTGNVSTKTMHPDSQNSSLSARGSELRDSGALAETWKAILADSYDTEENPNGIVNLGTSENVSEY